MTDAPARAVLYARVSNDDRGVEGRNLESQLELGRRYAAEHGYEIAAELSEDDRGASGAAFELPQLGRIYELAGQGDFDVLIVRELDRLSRKLEKQLMVERLLQDAGVAIEYVLYPYPDTPEGRLALLMRATIAEYERLKTRERTMRGRVNVVLRGKVILHGQPPPYGYRVEDGTLAPDEAQADVVRRIFQWYIHGDEQGQRMGSYRIAKRLTAERVPTWQDIHPKSKGITDNTQKQRGWAAAVVRQILRKRLYVGEWRYGQDNTLLEVPALIDEAAWQAARRQSDSNRARSRRNTQYEYLMSRRLTCGECGSTVYSFNTGPVAHGISRKRQFYYACAARRKEIVGVTCELPYFPARLVDDLAWQFVREVLLDPETRRKVLDEYRAGDEGDGEWTARRIAQIDDSLKELKRKLRRLLSLYLDGRFDKDALLAEQAAIEDEIKDHEVQRGELEQTLATEAQREARRREIERLIALYESQVEAANTDFALRRACIDALGIRARLSLAAGERAIHCYFE